ncbi:MAG TPA: hypothetical protein ENN80_14250 [Candidatus Hydrogenedentes bacterium]|mgnify:CR=1 FL=1|nr:hypothetical protein [Candidatus Hydrogenedentota bacterium]
MRFPKWIGVVSICVLLGAATGCGSSEKKLTLEAINNNPEIVQRGGHVKSIRFLEQDEYGRRPGGRGTPPGAYPFVGDILDAEGNPLGEVHGHRVEGLGTAVRRIAWIGEEQDGGRREQWQQRRDAFRRMRGRVREGGPLLTPEDVNQAQAAPPLQEQQ